MHRTGWDVSPKISKTHVSKAPPSHVLTSSSYELQDNPLGKKCIPDEETEVQRVEMSYSSSQIVAAEPTLKLKLVFTSNGILHVEHSQQELK